MAETSQHNERFQDNPKDSQREAVSRAILEFSKPGWENDQKTIDFLDAIKNNRELLSATEPVFDVALERLALSMASGEPMSDEDHFMVVAYMSCFGEKGNALVKMKSILESAGKASGENRKNKTDAIETRRIHAENELSEENLSVEQKEVQESQREVALLSKFVDLWSDKARRVEAGMWFKPLRSAGSDILTAATIARVSLKPLVEQVRQGRSVDSRKIEKIFDELISAEKSKAVVDGTAKVKEIVLDRNSSVEDRTLRMIDATREGWIADGDSEAAKKLLGDLLAERPNLADIGRLFRDENAIAKLFQAVESGQIPQIPGYDIPEAIAKTLPERFREFQGDMEKADEQFRKVAIEQDPTLLDDKKRLEDGVKSRKQAATSASFSLWFKDVLVSERIESHELDAKDKFAEKYAQIAGLGWSRIADTNKAAILSAGIDVALLVVPMGAGVVAGKIAASIAIRATMIAMRAGRAAEVVAGTVGFAAEATAFHYSQLLTENALLARDPSDPAELFDHFKDWKGVLKTTAFLGVMKVFPKVSAGLGKFGPQDSISLSVAKTVLLKARTLEAGSMVATAKVLDRLDDELSGRDSSRTLTVKEFLEMWALAGIYAGAGSVVEKHSQKKGETPITNGNPQNKEGDPLSPVAKNDKREKQIEPKDKETKDGVEDVEAILDENQSRERVLRGLKLLPRLIGDLPHALISSSALWTRGVKGVGLPGDIDIAVDGNRVDPASFAKDFLSKVASVNGEMGQHTITNIRFVDLRPKSEGKPIVLNPDTPEGLSSIANAIELGRLDVKFDYRDQPNQAQGLEMELFPERNGLGLTNLAETGKTVEPVDLEIDGQRFQVQSLSLEAASEGYVLNFLAEFYSNTVRSIRKAEIKDGHPDIKVKEAQRLWTISLALTEAGFIKSPSELPAFFIATIAKYEALPNKGNYVSDALANKNGAIEALKGITVEFKVFQRTLLDSKTSKESLPSFKDFEKQLLSGKIELGKRYLDFFSSKGEVSDQKMVLDEVAKIESFLVEMKSRLRSESDFAYFYEIQITLEKFVARVKNDVPRLGRRLNVNK